MASAGSNWPLNNLEAGEKQKAAERSGSTAITPRSGMARMCVSCKNIPPALITGEFSENKPESGRWGFTVSPGEQILRSFVLTERTKTYRD